jgi:hypothetical protein
MVRPTVINAAHRIPVVNIPAAPINIKPARTTGFKGLPINPTSPVLIKNRAMATEEKANSISVKSPTISNSGWNINAKGTKKAPTPKADAFIIVLTGFAFAMLAAVTAANAVGGVISEITPK